MKEDRRVVGGNADNNTNHRDNTMDRLWTILIIPFYMSVRIMLANRLPIMDCDETFNYWEPLHFLLYGKGLQTWEYSNTFALRTYAYLMPLVAFGRLYGWCLKNAATVIAQSSSSSSSSLLLSFVFSLLAPQQEVSSEKVAVFLLLRATLGAWMAWGEISFCRAVAESLAVDGRRRTTTTTSMATGLVTACLLLTSTGMAHSAAALLPSSTIMGLWMYAASAFLRQHDSTFVVLAVVATLAVGWPFGVLVFVPLGVAILIRRATTNSIASLLRLVLVIVAVTTVVQAIVMWIDHGQYGRMVSPVWNILLYNTQEGGDELYGVEPWTYYVKNLLLNFNYVAPVGLVGPLLLWPLTWLLPLNAGEARSPSTLTTVMAWLLLPMYLWMAVVAPRPHKEERFLFPIYPCLCLAAAWVSVVSIQMGVRGFDTVLKGFGNPPQPQRPTSLLMLLLLLGSIWIPAALISQSRSAALSNYYTAPLIVYSQLESLIDTKNALVCTCGEWYRFPSSFYIPMGTATIAFAPSSFQGQLPRPFTVHGSGPLATTTFNDKNKPEPGSLVHDLDRCDYMIDLSTSSDCRTDDARSSDDINGDTQPSCWKPVVQAPFFDAEQTTSTLHRTLYIPYIHEKMMARGGVQYTDFVLYQRSQR